MNQRRKTPPGNPNGKDTDKYAGLSAIALFARISTCRSARRQTAMFHELSRRTEDGAAVGLSGICYLHGYGVPHDKRKAFALLRGGCRLGDGASCSWLGYNFHMGEYSAPNPGKAISYYKRVIRLGDAENTETCAYNLWGLYESMGRKRRADYWRKRHERIVAEMEKNGYSPARSDEEDYGVRVPQEKNKDRDRR